MENVKGSGRKTTRSKGGRPKKTVKKSEIMMLRLAPAEREAIQKKAASAGMNPCEWVRQAAQKAVIIPRLNPEEASYLRTLSGMANNLNQLVKLAHTEGLLNLALQCRTHIEQVDLLIEKLLKL
ncbi:plasmid mobilization protein [Sphingobacterium sp.]|uniref:plasmid mobilization protein n=1 Tax=Sphingobacterium sp. TaxID=341027 RepID=UPI00289C106F|nr:plasmid mobilization relaxosome protein MobC [Sphingobacterium sp.]